MKKFVLMIIWGLFFMTKLFSAEIKLGKILTIGDQREDYTFFKISGAAIGPDKQIFVADSGGFFISQFSWDGRFLKRIGSFGQGPQEFQRISSLKVFKKFLYFNDPSNRRIGMVSTDLTNVTFIPFRSIPLRGGIDVLQEDRFLCTFSDISFTQGKGQVAVINAIGEVEICFFKYNQAGGEQSLLRDKAWAIKQLTSKIIAAVAPNKTEVLITFEYPDNPVLMFLFTVKGEMKKKCDLKLPDEYHFAKHLTSYPIQAPKEGIFYPVIRSLMPIQNGYLLHLVYKRSDDKNDQVLRSILVWLNEKGEKVAECDLAKDLVLFNATLDGLLLGTCTDDDEPRLSVFKTVFN